MKRFSEQRPEFADSAAEICFPAVESAISETEAEFDSGEMARLRNEKLDAVRAAIASGAYDSEELLEKAMDRMMRRLEQPDAGSV